MRDADIALEVAEGPQLTERLGAVLEAIYAAFGTGWEDVARGGVPGGLVEESVLLARLPVTLMPDEPEPRGLLALMLFADTRRPARRTDTGAALGFGVVETAMRHCFAQGTPGDDRAQWETAVFEMLASNVRPGLRS